MPFTDPTDEDLARLLKGARKHNTKAFEALYDALAPRVYAYCQNALNEREDADILFVDCFSFVMAWEEDIRDQTIGRKSCLISMFHSNVAAFVRAWLDEIKDHIPPPLTSLPPLPDPVHNSRSDNDVFLQEELSDLRDFLRALSEPTQLFIRAAYLHSESYSTLAEKLKITPAVLRQRVREDVRQFIRNRSDDWQNGEFLDHVAPEDAVTALEDVLVVLPVKEARQFADDVQASDQLTLVAIAWARLLAPMPATFYPLQPQPHLKKLVFQNFKGFKGFVRRHFLTGLAGAAVAGVAGVTIAHLPEILGYRDKKCCVREIPAFMRLDKDAPIFWAATATVQPESIYGPWYIRVEQRPENLVKATVLVKGGGLHKTQGIRIWAKTTDGSYHYISEIDDDSHFHVDIPWATRFEMKGAILYLYTIPKKEPKGPEPDGVLISEGPFYKSVFGGETTEIQTNSD